MYQVRESNRNSIEVIIQINKEKNKKSERDCRKGKKKKLVDMECEEYSTPKGNAKFEMVELREKFKRKDISPLKREDEKNKQRIKVMKIRTHIKEIWRKELLQKGTKKKKKESEKKCGKNKGRKNQQKEEKRRKERRE